MVISHEMVLMQVICEAKGQVECSYPACNIDGCPVVPDKCDVSPGKWLIGTTCPDGQAAFVGRTSCLPGWEFARKAVSQESL